jgi:hypothetical protein
MMHSRGQASIEFIFVLVFMFVLLVGVILPLGLKFQSSLDDVGRAGAVASGVKQVQYTLGLMTSTHAGGRQVVGFFIPRDSNFSCDPSGNTLSVSLPLALPVFDTNGSVPSSCVQLTDDPSYSMRCVKQILVPFSVDLTCGGSATDSFVIETGGAGFTQDFAFGSTYNSLQPKPYVIDVRTEG